MATETLDKQTLKDLAQKGRDSLFFFSRAILGFDKMTAEIHKPICEMIQAHLENPRIALVLPRGWYKSTMATICYPIWRAVVDPEVRILLVQNTYTNACGKLSAVKQIVESNELFKALYPEILPTKSCTWAKDIATVNRKGAYPEGTWEAAGTGTQKTGQHYDLIIEDDTVSPDKDNLTGVMMQPTQAEIEKAIGWHKLGSPLLIEPTESQRIVVGTRWAENDLLGYIIENSIEYKILTRAVKETNGKPDPEGEIQWSKRFNQDVLDALERELGPHMFSSLYLNFPTSAANQVFKREWVHYYETRPRTLVVCTSVDLACAELEESSDPDYNAIVTTGLNPYTGQVYILHYTRERMSPSSVVNCIFDHYRTFQPIKVIIEGIGYQRTLQHWLELQQRKRNVHFFVEVIKGHRGSKLDRVRGLQPFFAAERMFLRSYMSELEREVLTFPKGAHDDIVDALSMQLNFWNEASTLMQKEKQQRLMKNPHSADVIIAELAQRVSALDSYPNDMGLMGTRFLNNTPIHPWPFERAYSRI